MNLEVWLSSLQPAEIQAKRAIFVFGIQGGRLTANISAVVGRI